MNFIKWIGLLLTGKAKDIYEAGEEHVTHTLRLLYVAVGVPAAMLVLGVIVGAIGDSAGYPVMVDIARGTLVFSGFFAALLLTLFWVRAAVFTELITLASTGVSRLLKGEVPAEVTAADADRFLRWLRGVTLWISAVALYAQIVPIWRNVWLTLMVGTCAIILSAMMNAKWFGGRWAQWAYAITVAQLFLFGTVTLIAPKFVRSVGNSVAQRFQSINAWNERHDRLSAVVTKADRQETALDEQLLRKFTARRNQLRRRAVQLCNGDFCSEAERREYTELGRKIEKVRKGTYWNDRSDAAGRKGTGRTSAAAVPTSRGNASTLPPPPPAPGPVVHASVDRSPSVASCDRSGLSKAQIDGIFRELHKYPNLRP